MGLTAPVKQPAGHLKPFRPDEYAAAHRSCGGPAGGHDPRPAASMVTMVVFARVMLVRASAVRPGPRMRMRRAAAVPLTVMRCNVMGVVAEVPVVIVGMRRTVVYRDVRSGVVSCVMPLMEMMAVHRVVAVQRDRRTTVMTVMISPDLRPQRHGCAAVMDMAIPPASEVMVRVMIVVPGIIGEVRMMMVMMPRIVGEARMVTMMMSRIVDEVRMMVVSVVTPVGPPVMPGSSDVIIVPVGSGRESYHRNVDLSDIIGKIDVVVPIKVVEISRGDPATLSIPTDIAPAVVADAVVDVDTSARRDRVDNGIPDARACTHMHHVRRISSSGQGDAWNREQKHCCCNKTPSREHRSPPVRSLAKDKGCATQLFHLCVAICLFGPVRGPHLPHVSHSQHAL